MATNPWKVGLITLTIILLVVAFVRLADSYVDGKYREGYEAATVDAGTVVSQYLISNLQEEGFVPFIIGNETIRLYPVR